MDQGFEAPFGPLSEGHRRTEGLLSGLLTVALDFVSAMMLKRRFEVLIWMPVCNDVRDTLGPARLRQGEIVHGELKMIA